MKPVVPVACVTPVVLLLVLLAVNSASAPGAGVNTPVPYGAANRHESPGTVPTSRANYKPYTRQSLRTFEGAFTFLSEQGRVAFVAEGTPLHPELTDAQADDLDKTLKALPRDAQGRIKDFDAVVIEVADAYDYEAKRLKQGRQESKSVLLLTKRYTDPEDLPYITLEEGAGRLRSILKATEKIIPAEALEAGSILNVARLYYSFTPEQKEAANGDSGLSVAELTPEQRRQLWILGTGQQYQSLHTLRQVYLRLSGCLLEGSDFCRFETGGLNAFGYTGPFGPQKGYIYKVALSHGLFTGAGGGVRLVAPSDEVEFVNGKYLRLPEDTGVPDPTKPVRPLFLPLACATTLGKLSERMPAPAGKSESGAAVPTITVDPGLAAKPVSLFGSTNATEQKDLWDGVAAVYGLRLELVRREGKPGYRLTLPAPRVLDRPEDIPAEIVRLLPPAMNQIPVGGFDRGMKASAAKPLFPRPSARPLPAIAGMEIMRNRAARQWVFMDVYRTALLRLRAMVEPKVPPGGTVRIPVRDSGDDPKCLVAVTSLMTLGVELDDLIQRETPPGISDFKNWFLVIQYEGENSDSVNLGFGVVYHGQPIVGVGGGTSIPKFLLKDP